MPVPTAITDLSTVAASNYPAGGDLPSSLDNTARAHAAFIAQLRDGAGNTASIAAHATTCNFWQARNITLTGSAVTFTNCAAAPFAGYMARVENQQSNLWTDGAVFEIQGDANFQAEAGDICWVFAKTTTTFRVFIERASGYAVNDRKKTLEHYYRATDNGDFSLAWARFAATGGFEVLLSSENVYTFDNPIVIDRAVPTKIVTTGRWAAELKLRGANTILFDVGNASSVRYGFYLDNALITKENASTSGSVIRLRNVGFWGINNCRVFGEYKYWRGIDCYASFYGTSEKNSIENVRREAVWIRGGGPTVGAVDGQAVFNVFDKLTFDGAHDDTASPGDQGVCLVGDYAPATWFFNTAGYRHHGYAFYFSGTSAASAYNHLPLVINPNIEATLTNSATLRAEYHSAGYCGGHSWSEANGLAAVRFDSHATGWRTQQTLFGLKGAAAIGVQDDGTDNETSITVQGYDAGAIASATAFKTGVNAVRASFKNCKASSVGKVIDNLGGSSAGHTFSNIEYHTIAGTALNGITTANNYNIDGLVLMGASSFVSVATTITIPPGKKTITLVGTGTIDEITPGYFGQRALIRMPSAGISFRDIDTTTKNVVLKQSATTFTSASGRENITLEYRGDYWWEIARTA